MPLIEAIEHSIQRLSSGEFQSLCDVLLQKEGLKNVVRLGSETGSTKTTAGTPDTWSRTKNGKYTLVEYTTQQASLATKIEDDINKCLDYNYVHIPIDCIEKIIYYHTSSNLKPGDDYRLHKKCEANGVELVIHGINDIAFKLYSKHRDLAKEYLGINIDSGQICDSDEFIRRNNQLEYTAPLNTMFIGRENELERITSAFATNDVVVLVGPAGVGKSRIALEYAKRRVEETNEVLLCIRDNALPIYEDLHRYISPDKEYFLFVDDANELSGLKHILEFVTGEVKGAKAKLLLTVRDYAVRKLIDDLRGRRTPKVVSIKPLVDEQISQLIQKNYGDLNDKCMSKIVSIAAGNARIAMIAGKTAKETNRIDSISDLTDLYDFYYGNVLQTNGATSKADMICLGIVAALSPFDKSKLPAVRQLLDRVNISDGEFSERLLHLHENELIEIHFDEIIRFGEQCLNNYILKRVFIDLRYISVADLIQCCFPSCLSKAISVINTIHNVFPTETVERTIECAIQSIWGDFKARDKNEYHEFMKAFYHINPSEALLYIQKHIEKTSNINRIPTHKDIIEDKKNQTVSDDFLLMIGGFSNTLDLPTALDLFFTYLKKQSSEFMQFYHLSCQAFGITENAVENGLYTQNTFIDKLFEYSDNWSCVAVRTLFLELAPTLLSIEHSYTSIVRGNKLLFVRCYLRESDILMQYRKRIWDAVIALTKLDNFRDEMIELLNSYPNYCDEECWSIIQAEAKYVITIAKMVLDPKQINDCLIVEKLVKSLIKANADIDLSTLSDYFDSQIYTHYKLLSVHTYADFSSEQQDKAIRDFVTNNGAQGVLALIDSCIDLSACTSGISYVVRKLEIAFDALGLYQEDFCNAIGYMLSKESVISISYRSLLNIMFKHLPVSDVENIIFSGVSNLKNTCQFAFYMEYPQESINDSVASKFQQFLASGYWKEVDSSCWDLGFLTKYMGYSPSILHDLIENEYIDGNNVHTLIGRFCSALFDNDDRLDTLVSYFCGDYELLAQTYMSVVRTTPFADYYGRILMAMNQQYPHIIDLYAEFISEVLDSNSNDFGAERLNVFFSENNGHETMDKILDMIISKKYSWRNRQFLAQVISSHEGDGPNNEEKQKWIEHIIENHAKDANYMEMLFEIIATKDNASRKAFTMLFLEKNKDFSAFSSLPILPRSYSWSGSAVPMYEKHRDYLQDLSSSLIGLQFLHHKQHVNELIHGLELDIQREEIRDILNATF